MITLSDLKQFTGTEHYYKHWLGRLVYTDGVAFLAENAKAYWLLDAIASYNRKEEFQVWDLVVDGGKAVLTMKEDTGQPLAVRQEIKYTDFPMDHVKLYLKDGVLMLPSEY